MLIVPNSHPKGQICLRLVDGRTEFNLSLKTLFCVSFFSMKIGDVLVIKLHQMSLNSNEFFMSQRMVRLLRAGKFDPIPMQCINQIGRPRALNIY